MFKVLVERPGGYGRLRLVAAPDPLPAPGDVLVGVESCGVNYADCLTRMGLYVSARRYGGYPLTPGFEVAGRVIGLGEGVSDLKIGDAVMALTRFGGYATRLVVPRTQVFPLPPGMGIPEGGGLPAVFLTAWFALFELSHPRAGANVLVHSAAGGVGGAAVQLAKLAGCRVAAVVGSAEKTSYARALGADCVIDKSSHPLWQQAEHWAPRGFDVILDANGCSTLAGSYGHLAAPGKLVVYGFHSMLPRRGGRPSRLRLITGYLRTPRFNPLRMTNRNRSVLAFNLSFLFHRSDLLALAMGQLIEWLEAGRIRPHAVTSYPLERVCQAHRDLESGQTRGKLVLTTDGLD